MHSSLNHTTLQTFCRFYCMLFNCSIFAHVDTAGTLRMVDVKVLGSGNSTMGTWQIPKMLKTVELNENLHCQCSNYT